MKLLDFFIVGVTIVVVAVPEGLPLAVTIALAFSMRQMLADKNLVRELKACETMGSATVIASDKTGTLTENRMSVVSALVHDVHWRAQDEAEPNLRPAVAASLSTALAVNSTAGVTMPGAGLSQPDYVGNKTEGSMLWWAMQHAGAQPAATREEADIVYRVPFSSARKFMLTVVRGDMASAIDQDMDFAVTAKGAPEVVLPACTGLYRGGALQPLTAARRTTLQQQIDSMAADGMRTIVVAARGFTAAAAKSKFGVSLDDSEEVWQDQIGHTVAEDESGGHALLADLAVVAVFGIADPLRREVPAAIARCQSAGIRVIMVTGDNMATAQCIARQAGIMGAAGQADATMTGAQFRSLTAEERAEAVQTLAVLARSSPSDKKLLVHTLQDQDEVVAVTGDGVNDAAALRAAHVGLAMGIAGTEVAKEASDMIITDDNFASITHAVKWGRGTMEHIRCFLVMQMSVCAVALTTTMLAAMVGRPLPLNATMLLWVNLIMDSAAALALATEPPTDDLLKRGPEPKGTSLITTVMAKNIAGMAVVQLGLLGWLMMAPAAHAMFGVLPDTMEHTTVIFNVFVWLQWWNMINARKVHDEWNVFSGVTHSYWFMAIAAGIALGQVAIVEYAGAYAGTASLSASQWVWSIALGALALPAGAALKFIRVVDQADQPVVLAGAGDDESKPLVSRSKRWVVEDDSAARARSSARARST